MRERLDGTVVVGRAEAAGRDQQVVGEPVAERRLELGRRIADDPQLRRLDAEREQRAREERPVEVGAIAADELRPGDDDGGARPAYRLRLRARAFPPG